MEKRNKNQVKIQNSLRREKPLINKNKYGIGAAQWENACLACTRPWSQGPMLQKKKKIQTYVFKTVNATLVRFGLTMMTVLLKINLSRKAGGGGQGLLLMALCLQAVWLQVLAEWLQLDNWQPSEGDAFFASVSTPDKPISMAEQCPNLWPPGIELIKEDALRKSPEGIECSEHLLAKMPKPLKHLPCWAVPTWWITGSSLHRCWKLVTCHLMLPCLSSIICHHVGLSTWSQWHLTRLHPRRKQP